MSGNGDYISREEAFNAILKLAPKVDDDGYCWVIRGDAATAIDSIPAADVREVVKASWEEWEEGGQKFYTCSKCFQPYYRWDNYCPNCGADMRPETPEEG